MQPAAVPCGSPLCSRLRVKVLGIAVFSRVLCLVLTSQWPRYFRTYHTSTGLLHPSVQPLHDTADWRVSIRRAGGALITQALSQQTSAGKKRHLCTSRCQEISSVTTNALAELSNQISVSNDEICAQQESVPLLARKSGGVEMLPVILPAGTVTLQMLASAPLHDKRVQASLAKLDKQNFVLSSIPVTARRPMPLSVTVDRCSKEQDRNTGRQRSEALNVPNARPSHAEELSGDRRLWHLLTPFLSWDGEYFLACALQGTQYFFEMTHAFFPGLGLAYIAFSEMHWPALKKLFHWSYLKREFVFAGKTHFLPPAFSMSDTTRYALVAVVVSNVSFILATMGVFEIALVLFDQKNGGVPQAFRAKRDWDSNASHRCMRSASRDEPVTLYLQQTATAQRRPLSVSPIFRQRTARYGEENGTVSAEEDSVSSASDESTELEERDSQEFCIMSTQHNQTCKNKFSFWAASWYAFCGASVHMSAAYTDSLFACLSIWALVLLHRAEDSVSYGKGGESPPSWRRSRKVELMAYSSVTEFCKQFKDRLERTRTTPCKVPQSQDPLKRRLIREKEVMSYARISRVHSLSRRLSFSWAATLLFSAAALLRSNGILSLIPLFFHTFRSCPAFSRFNAAVASRSSYKRGLWNVDKRVISTIRGASSPLKIRSPLCMMKLATATFVHWANALLQALAVLLPFFLVLAYPYHLYCACPHPFTSAHAHSYAVQKNASEENHHCQTISGSLGRSSNVLFPFVCIASLPVKPKTAVSHLDRVSSGFVSASPTGCASALQPLPSPPSFIAFTLFFLREGVFHSLRTLFSALRMLVVSGWWVPQLAQNSAGHVRSGSAEYGSEQRRNCVPAPCTSQSTPYLQGSSTDLCATFSRPVWCTGNIPNVYTYVQRQYWGVEFLGFFRLKTLYLILSTLPFYGVSILCVTYFLTCCGWIPKNLRFISCHKLRNAWVLRLRCQPHCNAGAPRREVGACAKIKSCCEGVVRIASKEETGHVVQLAVLTITMLLFAHANVSRTEVCLRIMKTLQRILSVAKGRRRRLGALKCVDLQGATLPPRNQAPESELNSRQGVVASS